MVTISLNEIFPVILYLLGSILLVVLIILSIKAIATLSKVNRVMDDLNDKSHKLDNLFDVIDNTTDMISDISDKFLGLVVNGITTLVHKVKAKKGEKEKNEEE